jgi:hypothetical protein
MRIALGIVTPRIVCGRQLELGQHQVGSRDIGGAGDVVHVAGAHQRVDVGFVRLRRHRVAQENHCIDLAFDQQRADLQVTAEGAGMLAVDRQAQLIGQAPAGGAGGGQVAAAQEVRVLGRQRDHVVFFLVVRNQRYPWFHLRLAMIFSSTACKCRP